MEFIKTFEKLARTQKIQEISIFINNICNLKCSNCYVKELSDNPEESIQNEEWMPFLADAINDNTRLISVVGKEPFMTPKKTIDFFQKLDKISGKRIRKGVVSNLILMTPQIAEKLSDINNLYVDVSLDGLRNIHEKMRGNGSFNKAFRGINYLRNAGVTDIFVSHLLCRNNAESFCDFISSYCSHYELKKFSVFPLCDAGAKNPLRLSADEYCRVLEKAISGGIKARGAEIIFKTDYLEPEVMLAVIDKFVVVDELKEDANGVLYNSYYDRNGNTFYFNFAPFPLEFISALRINHKGDVVFCCDMPSGSSIINIREGYDAVKKQIHSKKVINFYGDYFKRTF